MTTPSSSLTQEEIILTLISPNNNQSAVDAWTSSRIGWDPESYESVCKWDGIRCDQIHDQVQSIILEDQHINWLPELPSELGLLTGLKDYFRFKG